MLEVSTILKKASDTIGFDRVKYSEHKFPTSIQNVTVMPFFGDIRSTFILSSLLLKRYKEESKSSQYFILCSWKGMQDLFPYVDEYWQVGNSLENLYYKSCGFSNESFDAMNYIKGLNHHFHNVVSYEDIKPYYDNGITKEFFDRYGIVKVTLPNVPSGSILPKDMRNILANYNGPKILLFPIKRIQKWRYGKTMFENISKNFWINLVEILIKEGYCPVIYQNFMTHDISPDFADKCAFFDDVNISILLGAMRFCGCALDVFGGISRLAIAARCPYIAFDERSRYTGMKEHEIDDLCGQGVPREYVFSFPSIVEGDNVKNWQYNVYDVLLCKLEKMLPDMDRDTWPSTVEDTFVVSYDNVREKKSKKIGTKFIKVKSKNN